MSNLNIVHIIYFRLWWTCIKNKMITSKITFKRAVFDSPRAFLPWALPSHSQLIKITPYPIFFPCASKNISSHAIGNQELISILITLIAIKITDFRFDNCQNYILLFSVVFVFRWTRHWIHWNDVYMKRMFKNQMMQLNSDLSFIMHACYILLSVYSVSFIV